MPHGVTGDQGVKSAGFDYSFSFNDKGDEDIKKSKFDNFPGGLFTVPNHNNVAFNNSTGGRDDGSFLA